MYCRCDTYKSQQKTSWHRWMWNQKKCSSFSCGKISRFVPQLPVHLGIEGHNIQATWYHSIAMAGKQKPHGLLRHKAPPYLCSAAKTYCLVLCMPMWDIRIVKFRANTTCTTQKCCASISALLPNGGEASFPPVIYKCLTFQWNNYQEMFLCSPEDEHWNYWNTFHPPIDDGTL